MEAGAGGAVGGGSDPFGGALGGLGGLGGAMGGMGGGMPGGMPPGVTPEMYQKMMKVWEVVDYFFPVIRFRFYRVGVDTLSYRRVRVAVERWLKSS